MRDHPLSVPPSWEVLWVQPALGQLSSQDVLQLRHRTAGLLLDVGWYPDEDPAGQFMLLLVADEAWERPLLRRSSRSLPALLDQIEEVCEAAASLAR
jgi:hypothetical protein